MKQKSPLNRSSVNYNLQQPPPPQPSQEHHNPASSILEAGPANIILPLRLFLGISFLAAGFDKLFDPQFFDPKAGGYIGNQLAGFAGQSPLGGFLTDIALPQATIFGALVLVGELAIGLGTLLGLYSRAAAFFGFVLSLILWLTASWQVTPFFLGSDLPYAMGWLTLFLTGPHPILSLDAKINNRTSGVASGAAARSLPANVQNQFRQNEVGVVSKGQVPYQGTIIRSEEEIRLARRQFLIVTGGTVLAGALTGAAWVHSLNDKAGGQPAEANQLTLPPTASTSPAGSTPTNQSTPSTSVVTPGPTGGASAPPPAGNSNSSGATQVGGSTPPTQTPVPQPAVKGPVIGKLAAIPLGNVLAFKTPDTGESAYLVHAKDGSVKAFSRICTHEGCEVSFVQSNQVFVCPCHGAQFDVSSGAALRRPARQPLQSFAVKVDGSGNIIYTA